MYYLSEITGEITNNEAKKRGCNQNKHYICCCFCHCFVTQSNPKWCI